MFITKTSHPYSPAATPHKCIRMFLSPSPTPSTAPSLLVVTGTFYPPTNTDSPLPDLLLVPTLPLPPPYPMTITQGSTLTFSSQSSTKWWTIHQMRSQDSTLLHQRSPDWIVFTRVCQLDNTVNCYSWLCSNVPHGALLETY